MSGLKERYLFWPAFQMSGTSHVRIKHAKKANHRKNVDCAKALPVIIPSMKKMATGTKGAFPNTNKRVK